MAYQIKLKYFINKEAGVVVAEAVCDIAQLGFSNPLWCYAKHFTDDLLHDCYVDMWLGNKQELLTARNISKYVKDKYKGVAKLRPGDTWNEKTGMKIARSKALHKFYKDVKRYFVALLNEFNETESRIKQKLVRNISFCEREEKYHSDVKRGVSECQ